MKVKLNHWYNWMTGVLLSLLGFSSCSNENDDPGKMICLYGTPTTHYIIKGKVTDTGGKPINGIKVEPAEVIGGDALNPLSDPVYTDKNGEYSVNISSINLLSEFNDQNYFEVTFEDVDGEANGGDFANDMLHGKDMKFKKVKKGEGAWNLGTYEITANKAMKKKQ